ncbi:MAG: plasmid stabilization protein [Nitrosomonadales bacterium SCN 54-20]|nr:MAG: plasmid stabilization protein [Nitrosomonadales bacterium SCN 54-20]
MGEAKTAYHIDWRPKASEDLRAIVACIGRDNPRRAKSFGEELDDKTQSLARHPELGRNGRPVLPDYGSERVVHRSYNHFLPGAVRNPDVEILRVKDAAQQTP